MDKIITHKLLYSFRATLTIDINELVLLIWDQTPNSIDRKFKKSIVENILNKFIYTFLPIESTQ